MESQFLRLDLDKIECMKCGSWRFKVAISKDNTFVITCLDCDTTTELTFTEKEWSAREIKLIGVPYETS